MSVFRYLWLRFRDAVAAERPNALDRDAAASRDSEIYVNVTDLTDRSALAAAACRNIPTDTLLRVVAGGGLGYHRRAGVSEKIFSYYHEFSDEEKRKHQCND